VIDSVTHLPNPEVLPPAPPGPPGSRARAARWFSDENLDLYAHFLDDCFNIPGTRIRLGLDGLIGLVPGLGDILAGIASSVLIVAAWIRGVPYVTLVRMLVNLGIAVVIGAVPIFGDIFDIAWQPNRRNYRLIVRHLREPHRHTGKDYAFLLCLLGAILALLLTPVIVLLLLFVWMVHRL
jgi:Domain of unknown function (DUF4112)